MPERQCDGCKRQADWGCEAKVHPATEKTEGARRNSNGEWQVWTKPSRLPLTIDGEESYGCPRQDIKEQPQKWARILLYFGFYTKGHLPEPGGVLDQSNKAMEVFRVLDAINAECDQALREKERDRRAREH